MFSKWSKKVQADIDEKVDISRIVIQCLEGESSKARVSSMEAANRVLDSWADRAPDFGSAQCDFQIVFEDGFRYHGHYRLNKSQKRVSLARHVRKQLVALATAADARKPAVADDKPEISMIGADVAESAKIALDNYNI
jgi:hypothetical protein